MRAEEKMRSVVVVVHGSVAMLPGPGLAVLAATRLHTATGAARLRPVALLLPEPLPEHQIHGEAGSHTHTPLN